MPTVKYAISDYVADGTTTDYLITWDYLDEDHISVYVDGTSNADPQADHTFTKLNSTTLRITDGVGGAIPAGAEIEIRRETPLLTRAITFADGSALLAEDLNKNSDYLLYSMQEVLDTVDAAAQDGALAAQVATEEFRDEAEGHKNNALAAQTATETARDTTQGYLATVQSDATDADNHRIAAAASQTAAAASQAAAATSETNSATSATASASSAAASLASEQASAASESASAASETAAAASETAAAASEAAAATSEANAAASYDNFDDRYLGAKSTAPTVDNDGDALLVGALYWNDVSDAMYVWNGSAWDTLPTSIGIADGATSTQVTITDTETTLNRLRITAVDDASLVGTTHGLQIGDTSANNITIDTNEILARSNGVAGTLKLQVEGGNVDFNSGGTGSCNLTMGNTTFLDKDRNATFASVATNEIRGYGNIVSYHNDWDASSSGTNGHLFYTNNNSIPNGGFQSNDFYIQDNLSLGRVRLPDDTYSYNTDGTSVCTVFASNIDSTYRCYSKMEARVSTDPDYGQIMLNSHYVGERSVDTSEADHHSHVLDNGGRHFSWGSQYAGRSKRGDSGTTSNYAAQDNVQYAYSGTGGSQGASTYTGFTGVIGRESANGDDVFVSWSAGSYRIEFDASGNGRFDGGADISSADYAEYFEWEDGNPNDEDRRGYPVVLVADGKIRIATEQDDDAEFLGIVSVEAAVVGDSAWAAWTGRYKKDKFGARVKEKYTTYNWGRKENFEDPYEYSYTEETAAIHNVTIPEDAIQIVKERPVYADDYDPDIEYTPRRDRVEWEAIGMLGKLPLFKGQPTKSTWRKLYDLSDETEMWLVR